MTEVSLKELTSALEALSNTDCYEITISIRKKVVVPSKLEEFIPHFVSVAISDGYIPKAGSCRIKNSLFNFGIAVCGFDYETMDKVKIKHILCHTEDEFDLWVRRLRNFGPKTSDAIKILLKQYNLSFYSTNHPDYDFLKKTREEIGLSV